jgi:hypothetical protein
MVMADAIGGDVQSRTLTLTGVLAGALFLAAVSTAALAYDKQFEDVPAGSTFASDIGWLDRFGITKGCNPPDNTRFCPKDPVTREQMAAFMHRLSDNIVFGTLREGKTDRGVWAIDQNPGWETEVAISFPRALPWTASVEVVPLGTAPSPNCPGNTDQPKANPGYLCVYVDDALNVETVSPLKAYAFGAILLVVPAGDGWTTASGTWALGGIDAG